MKNLLILKSEKIFGEMPRPKKICKDTPTTDNQHLVEKDFSCLQRFEMSDDQCKTMLLDGELMSDRAYLYFFPRLAEFVIRERYFEDFFYHRLEKIPRNTLTDNEIQIIEEMIMVAKQIEKENYEEIVEEARQGAIQWEQEMLERGTVDDLFLVAACKGDLEKVKLFVENGANLNAIDFNHRTAYDLAELMERKDVIFYLKSLGIREK